MKIISLSENKDIEKRIAITPETSKKYISLVLMYRCLKIMVIIWVILIANINLMVLI